MNCKPGDLAFVVRDYRSFHLGRIVKCVRMDWVWPDTWLTEPELVDPDGTVFTPENSALRPIRDPGDDAVDESRAWLPPVPTQERETA